MFFSHFICAVQLTVLAIVLFTRCFKLYWVKFQWYLIFYSINVGRCTRRKLWHIITRTICKDTSNLSEDIVELMSYRYSLLFWGIYLKPYLSRINTSEKQEKGGKYFNDETKNQLLFLSGLTWSSIREINWDSPKCWQNIFEQKSKPK